MQLFTFRNVHLRSSTVLIGNSRLQNNPQQPAGNLCPSFCSGTQCYHDGMHAWYVDQRDFVCCGLEGSIRSRFSDQNQCHFENARTIDAK